MCSETKGEKSFVSFHFNWKQITPKDFCLYDVFPPAHRLGIWLFMSEMPYGTLSSSMLWKVLHVMQCAETAGQETPSTAADTHSCIQALRGIITHTYLHKIESSKPEKSLNGIHIILILR